MVLLKDMFIDLSTSEIISHSQTKNTNLINRYLGLTHNGTRFELCIPSTLVGLNWLIHCLLEEEMMMYSPYFK